ncbi:MAG: hypothetical protein E7619_08105 [Ruminococcaceae bacterium]|nr:hypothetical protein [Oscillospiraceae bacterium]
MSNKITESGEILFWRAFKYSLLRSLPCAAIPVIGAIICIVAGYSHKVYFGVFLTACVLSVIATVSVIVRCVYKAFPRKNDGNSPSIISAVLLSGFLGTALDLISCFACGAICGAITKTGHAGAFLLIMDNAFTAAFLLFIAALVTVQAVLAATSLAVLNGKKKKKSIVSRTCRAAVPIFTVLGVYYVIAILLFTFTDMSFTANIAVDYFLTEDVLWLITAIIPTSGAAWTALWLLCAKSAKSAK